MGRASRQIAGANGAGVPSPGRGATPQFSPEATVASVETHSQDGSVTIKDGDKAYELGFSIGSFSSRSGVTDYDRGEFYPDEELNLEQEHYEAIADRVREHVEESIREKGAVDPGAFEMELTGVEQVTIDDLRETPMEGWIEIENPPVKINQNVATGS